MQSVAKSKYIRISPRKMRQVLELVRGKRVDEAINILHFTVKGASLPVEKTIRSAVANLGNLEEGERIDIDQIYIKEAFVDAGPTLKRFRPMSMGRAGRIRKRTSHITIVLEDTKQE
jgi:large subunit ribosomal protein L22